MNSILKSVERGISRALNLAGIVGFLGVLGITFAQVLTRYVLKTPLAASEELSRILFIWISFLGAAMVMKGNEHIRLDVVKEYIGVRMSIVLEIFIQMLLFLFNSVMVVQGIYLMTITTRQVTSVTRIPMSYIYLIIPLSFSVMMIYGIMIMVRLVADYTRYSKEGGKR